MKKYGEAIKNFINCGLLMLLCAVGLIVIGKTTIAYIAIAGSVIFVAIGVIMYFKNKDGSEEE